MKTGRHKLTKDLDQGRNLDISGARNLLDSTIQYNDDDDEYHILLRFSPCSLEQWELC